MIAPKTIKKEKINQKLNFFKIIGIKKKLAGRKNLSIKPPATSSLLKNPEL